MSPVPSEPVAGTLNRHSYRGHRPLPQKLGCAAGVGSARDRPCHAHALHALRPPLS